ncbi:MAG: hypothetical protein IIA48_11780 [Bacteroidetes bacterium]|nr:hypothetical protein [Bacteroidota bacterium]
MKTQKLDSTIRYNLHNYFIAPVFSGIYGFAIFFTTLIMVKGLGTFVGSIPEFNIELVDAEMSILGFVFLFLIRFLKNYLPKD